MPQALALAPSALASLRRAACGWCTPITASCEAVLDGAGRGERGRHARRPGRVVDAARRAGPRLQLPPRRAARHADGSDARARPPPSVLAEVDESDAGRRDLTSSARSATRGASPGPSSRRASRRRSRPPASWRRSSGGRAGGEGWQRIDPATRTFQALRIWVNARARAARRRSCAAPPCGCVAGRAAGGDQLPLARGPHRQAHAARARSRRGPGAGADRASRSSPATARSTRTLGPAAPSCAPPSGWLGRRGTPWITRDLRVRDQQGRPQQPDRARGRRAPPARVVAARSASAWCWCWCVMF